MVPPASHGISRVPRYSGYRRPACLFEYATLTLCGVPSHALLLKLAVPYAVRNPKGIAALGLA